MEDVDSDDHFWRVGSYLEDNIADDQVGPGIRLMFIHRPLSRYVHELGRCGLLIDDMVEPAPPPAIIQETGGFPNASSIPRLLLLWLALLPESEVANHRCDRSRSCPGRLACPSIRQAIWGSVQASWTRAFHAEVPSSNGSWASGRLVERCMAVRRGRLD